MLKLRRLNDIIIDLQRTCNEVGNFRVGSIGATSDGSYSFHLLSDSNERIVLYISQFEDQEGA